MILTKDGQTKILGDGSSLIGVLKSQGWVEVENEASAEEKESMPEVFAGQPQSWLGKIKQTITGD